jgi:hypothetical protein
VSHIPQRTEKDCLNCGTIVNGRYCHVCGQENVVPKETFWHMVTHFFYDITHFDSKFFTTLKDLLFKPGFLPKEYINGRRASYLHPIKMYVFTSAMFFLLFFSFFSPKTNISNLDTPMDMEQRRAYAISLQEDIRKDSSNTQFKRELEHVLDSTRPFTVKDAMQMERGEVFITFISTPYRTFAAYDSAEKLLPKSQRDGWIVRRLTEKQININKKFRQDPKAASEKLFNNILHKLPYMLFVSLPIFAFILQLVYVRRRKQFYYADHGVFTLHLYIFSFLLLLVVFCLSRLQDITGYSVFGWILAILLLIMFFYLYKAMRNFYGQKRGKTFLKFLLVAFWSLVMMLILLVIFFFFSAFSL